MSTSPFTAEHEALRDAVRRLVDDHLAPLAATAETEGSPPPEAIDRCRSMGLFELGDPLAEVVAAEELGRLRSGGLVAVLLAQLHAGALGVAPVAAVVSGHDTLPATFPMVVGGAVADTVVLPDAGVTVHEFSAEAVDRPHALRGAGLADLDTTGARAEPLIAPPENVRAAARDAALARAAATVSAARTTWEDARRYAAEREAFGRPIGRFQVNLHTLAEGATLLEAARALVVRTAWAAATGEDPDPGPAERFAARVAGQVSEDALQLHGGYGYTAEFDVSRAWRDARALRVASPAREAGPS